MNDTIDKKSTHEHKPHPESKCKACRSDFYSEIEDCQYQLIYKLRKLSPKERAEYIDELTDILDLL